MKLVILHPTGNANVRAAASGLAKANLLHRFYTAIACFPGSVLDRISGFPFLSEFRRRSFDLVLQPFTKTIPWPEIGRLLFTRLKIDFFLRHELGPLCIDAVYQKLDERVSTDLKNAKKAGVQGIYGFEDGALRSFKEGKKLGLHCFYDLPTGYWRASRELLAIELQRCPEWAMTFTGFEDSEEKLARKDQELHLADSIFVASEFTAETLKFYPGPLNEVQVIPYGFPDVGNAKDYPTFQEGRSLRLLYVGKLSQQKGIADLFAAVDAFTNKVSLTIVGQKGNYHCDALDKNLAKHRWIPSLSHEAVIAVMREHDVLVFPSLFDGFGLVISEAMAQGTPVIASERSAGPSLIKDGINGWLVTAGSRSSLKAAIGHLLQFPELIESSGKLAMETARARPWALYSKELNQAITRHLARNGDYS